MNPKKSNTVILPDLNKAREIDKRSLCMLTRTTPNVRDMKSIEPAWVWLAEQYRNADESDSTIRAALDVINACLTQNRIVFNLSRPYLLSLTKSSKNWSQPMGFSDGTYKNIQRFMFENGIISLYMAGNKRTASAFTV